MKLCDEHWKKLRAAITARGVDAGVSEHGRHLGSKVKQELEGAKRTKENYDPLMGASMMIYSHSIEHGGLAMLVAPEEGQPELCPICHFTANCPTCATGEAERWIEYAARDSSEVYLKLPDGP